VDPVYEPYDKAPACEKQYENKAVTHDDYYDTTDADMVPPIVYGRAVKGENYEQKYEEQHEKQSFEQIETYLVNEIRHLAATYEKMFGIMYEKIEHMEAMIYDLKQERAAAARSPTCTRYTAPEGNRTLAVRPDATSVSSCATIAAHTMESSHTLEGNRTAVVRPDATSMGLAVYDENDQLYEKDGKFQGEYDYPKSACDEINTNIITKSIYEDPLDNATIEKVLDEFYECLEEILYEDTTASSSNCCAATHHTID